MQYSILQLLKNICIPNQCIICHTLSDDNLCDTCLLKIPHKPKLWINNHITQPPLFRPTPFTEIQYPLENSHLITVLSCTLFNDPIIRKSIHYLKYKNLPQLSNPLGGLMLRAITQAIRLQSHIILCPITLHPKRLRFRTYNQSNLLAQYIARQLRLPIYTDLERIKNTPQQMKIHDKQERIDNVKEAFIAHSKPKQDDIIILIDDVTTTLSTINEAASALYKKGFRNIHAVILAH